MSGEAKALDPVAESGYGSQWQSKKQEYGLYTSFQKPLHDCPLFSRVLSYCKVKGMSLWYQGQRGLQHAVLARVDRMPRR